MKVETNKVKWLHLRLSEAEHQKITASFKKTTCRKLSQYARNVLLQKPVTVKYRNESADAFLADLATLRSELNAIGNNLNQAVRKLHTLKTIPEIKDWCITTELHRQAVFNNTDQIREKLKQISLLWLQ